MGFDTPASLGKGETGGTVVGPIWHDFMAAALKDLPNLPFHVPDGMTVATWAANVTDAFKPGQAPGQSGPTIGGGDAPTDASGLTASTGGTGTGVDSGVGGLY